MAICGVTRPVVFWLFKMTETVDFPPLDLPENLSGLELVPKGNVR